jgi:LysR family transcriptional regulator, transcriptional activator for bauABCD operon
MLPPRLFTGQLGDFELRLLKIFRTVVDCGGFSLAEAELGTTKSAISKQMSDLEKRLGLRLCDRGRGGFALTEEGKAVYKSSAKLFASVEDFRTSVNSIHEVVSGTLYLGFIDTIVTNMNSILHAALQEYSSQYPDVELSIMTGSAVEIDRFIQDRTIHIGVSTHNPGLKDVFSWPLFREDNYLYCGVGHPLFDGGSDTTIEDLKHHRFVQHGYSEAEQSSMSRIGAKATASAHFTEDVLFLVLTGNFLGFLPSHYAETFVKDGMIKSVVPDKLAKQTDIEMIVNKLSAENAMVARFVDIIEGMASAPKS